MNFAHVSEGDHGAPAFSGLSLPFIAFEGMSVDVEPLRRQARGEEPITVPPYIPASGLRCQRTVGEGESHLLGRERTLLVVNSGELRFGQGMQSEVYPRGSVILIDANSQSSLKIERHGDCRTVELGISQPWADGKPAPAQTADQEPNEIPNIRRIVKGEDDDLAYFAELDADMFGSAADGGWRPVKGFWIYAAPAGFFVDWHPEVVNNLCVFLYGEIEVEVSGDNATTILGPGDLLLGEDRTGVGHIDRIHADTSAIVIEIADEHLW